ncbi:restriction endonuclease [Nocardia sp. NPDC088792]|uniref:restriction endonuclease n=1 Tax=Nocardia sp. NPDC088792 TaxID=3364332 RepID=UPI003816A8D7
MGEPEWQRYQQRVADLLSNLGFATKVAEKLTSARGVVHEIDVSARRVIAGVDVLWVVECKLWKSAVTKEKVAALADICGDLGADRGLLMSESGFQSGAIQHATGRSITLTSVGDLRSNAAADLLERRQREAERRLQDLDAILNVRRWTGSMLAETTQVEAGLQFLAACVPEARLLPFTSEKEATKCETAHDVNEVVRKLASGSESWYQQAVREIRDKLAFRRFEASRGSVPGGPRAAEVRQRLALVRSYLIDARIGRWPVVFLDEPAYPRLRSDSSHPSRRYIAWTLEQLLPLVEPVLTACEEHEFTQRERDTLHRTRQHRSAVRSILHMDLER